MSLKKMLLNKRNAWVMSTKTKHKPEWNDENNIGFENPKQWDIEILTRTQAEMKMELKLNS